MKTIKLAPKSLLLGALLSTSLIANENFIEIGGGFSSSKDNFSTDSKATINGYNKAENESEGVPYISFFYGYELDGNNTIYVESEMGDLKLGYNNESNYGVFDVGFITSLISDEEWKNPFAQGANREKTDVSEMGGYISYGLPLTEEIFSSISYQLTNVDYDNETVAAELRREGTRHIISLENEVGPVMVNLNYEMYDADGKQSSYKQYGLEVGSQFELTERLSLMAMAGIGKKDYDETNQVLNKKIDATLYSVSTQLRYEEPFGLKDTYTTLKVGHEQENANHAFYDKESTFGVITMGYKF